MAACARRFPVIRIIRSSKRISCASSIVQWRIPMHLSRFALLVCSPALAIATAIGSQTAQAAGAGSNSAESSKPMALEFHPLRSSDASKRAGGSLKPNIDPAAPLAVNASLRMHVHADGAASYDCSEQHAEVAPVAASEKQK